MSRARVSRDNIFIYHHNVACQCTYSPDLDLEEVGHGRPFANGSQIKKRENIKSEFENDNDIH